MKIISSLNNTLITSLVGLKDKAKRLETSMFLVEGYHLVEEASKLSLLEMILSTDEVALKRFNAKEAYLVNDAIIKKLSTTKTPQNIIGVVKMPSLDSLNNLITKNNLKVVILDDVSDPGNLGTIIRTTAALGYDAVVASLNTVDYYNEKVIRASQGAIFRVKLLKQNLAEVIKELKNSGVKIFGTSLKQAIKIDQVNHENRFGVVFGNEAHGVSDEILALTDCNLVIPMHNDVESLNVGIASAIVMWELNQ